MLDGPGASRVAVVIPCFDDGATVEEAVDSVICQRHPVELVVVDDGSTDPQTLRAFERLERAGTTVLHIPNGGVAAARMAGLAATTAPYVLPLDADDRLAPGALARLADTLDRHPEAAAAWGSYQRFGAAGYVQGTAPSLDAWQITHQNDLPLSALYRRRAVIEAGGWALRDAFEDWDLWMSLAERGWAGVGTPEVTYLYRAHDARAHAVAARRYIAIHRELVARHPRLFAQRRRAWLRSRAPLALRLALPLVERLPLPRDRKRMLGGVVTHLAHRRGVRALVARARSGAE